VQASELPVIDAFTHTPWMGRLDVGPRRGDIVPWTDDRRLRRVLTAFQHGDADGGHTRQLDVQDVLAGMDRANVARALLPAKVYYRAEEPEVDALHRELARMAAESGGRLKVVASILPPELGPATYWDVMQNVRLIRRAHAEYGIVGVHLTPSPWGIPPNDRWFYPVYAACVDLGLAVFTYVGMPGPLWPLVPNDPIHLDEVALAFPDLPIIAHHIGDPWVDVMVRLAAHHPNVFICTSAWSPRRYPDQLVEFIRRGWHGVAGCEKVLFATDFPLTDLDKTVKQARELDVGADQLKAILADNARKMFWPDEPELQ
jgi:hypothetical protein